MTDPVVDPKMFRPMPDPVVDSIHAALNRLEATSPIKYNSNNAQGVFAFLPVGNSQHFGLAASAAGWDTANDLMSPARQGDANVCK